MKGKLDVNGSMLEREEKNRKRKGEERTNAERKEGKERMERRKGGYKKKR